MYMNSRTRKQNWKTTAISVYVFVNPNPTKIHRKWVVNLLLLLFVTAVYFAYILGVTYMYIVPVFKRKRSFIDIKIWNKQTTQEKNVYQIQTKKSKDNTYIIHF